MEFSPNPQKKLVIEIDGNKWLRGPIKTRFIVSSDKLENIIEKYVLPCSQKIDIIALCQKIVSITQNRIIHKKDVRVGYWARFLSRFAKKTPYGFSVGNPLKMQVAINLAGLPRILFAGFCGGIAKIFGISGMFYRIAGHQINQIDGFYGEAFSQYADLGILGLDKKYSNELCERLKNKYGLSFVIVDINDLGGNVLGKSREMKGKEKLILQILKDNPAGQADQQTPIIILRKMQGADEARPPTNCHCEDRALRALSARDEAI